MGRGLDAGLGQSQVAVLFEAVVAEVHGQHTAVLGAGQAGRPPQPAAVRVDPELQLPRVQREHLTHTAGRVTGRGREVSSHRAWRRGPGGQCYGIDEGTIVK